MPDLPQTAPQVSPEVQPSASMPMAVTPNALGAGVGEAIGTMGEVSHKIWYDAKQRADQAAVLDADNQVSAKAETLLRDPKTGLLYQQTGKDAPAATAQVLGDFDDHVAKTMDGLSNDQQKIAYQRMAQARRYDLQRTLDQYEHGQTEQYAKDVHDQAIAGTVNDAVNHASDPEAVSDALARQKALVADYGKGRLSQEAIDLQTQQHASTTNLAVIEHLASTGNDVAAKQWYDANADSLMAHDRLAADKMVKASSLAGQAQRWTDANVLTSDGELDTRANVDARVRSIADPQLRDEAQRRVDQRFEQAHAEHLDDQRSTMNAALKTAQSSPQGVNDPAVVTALTKLDPENADHVRAYFAKDGQIHSDPVEVNRLLVQSANDPKAFLDSMKDPALATKFAKPDLETLLSKQQEIQRNGAVSDGPGILSRAQIIDKALSDGGYAITNKSTGLTEIDRNNPGALKLLGAINQRVAAEEQATGKKLSPQRMQEIADQVTIQTAVQGPGLKRPTPVYALTADQRQSASRDLAEYAKTNPAEAAQLRSNMDDHARRLGVNASNLSDDQRNRAFAQYLINRDLRAAGDRVGAEAAAARYSQILTEKTADKRSMHQRAYDAMMARGAW